MDLELLISVRDNSIPPKKVLLFHDIALKLKEYFVDKFYSNELSKIKIGVMMVLVRPGYENWYKEKKSRYVNFKKIKSNVTGEITIIENTFSYEVKLNDQQFYGFTGGEHSLSISIVKETINSFVEKYSSIKTSVPDFNLPDFIKDVDAFFFNLSKVYISYP